MSGSRAWSAFLVDDGALMIVASTMVPLATFRSARREMAMDLLEQAVAQLVLFQQVAEAATVVSSGTGSRPKSMPTKPTYRRQIVERLLDRRVGQVEPVLQQVDAQHPLDPDRRAAIARLRRYLVPVPFPVWKAMAIAAQSLPGQGLTLNQVELMEQDNVAAGTGNLQETGVIPTPMAKLVTALASQPAAETTSPRT